MAQGDFWVDAQGLRSRAKPESSATTQQGDGNAAAAALIGTVLKGLSKQGGQQQQAAAPAVKLVPAEIFVRAAITNAFAIRLDLTVLDGAAPFAFGPYAGADRASGYRLLYTPSPQNARGTLELLRLSGKTSAVAGQAAGPVNLEGAAPHVIEWTRNGQGEMVVKLDRKDVMRVTDVSQRDAFGGLSLVNQGGDYAVRSVSVLGTP